MGDNANRRGAVDLAMPLMVLAFMAVSYTHLTLPTNREV